MKRSRINDILRESDAFMRSFGYTLPPFAYLSPDALKSSDHSEIKARRMGWDITDYGKESFDDLGLFLFTTRNGLNADLGKMSAMLYAEKIMISRNRQLSPMHRHDVKVEDIINRGGGTLVIELFMADTEGAIDQEADVTVMVDGTLRTLPAGGI